MCFKTFLNHPINQKTSQKKPNAITVLKKEGGGVRRRMIKITDSMVFFLKPSLSNKQKWFKIVKQLETLGKMVLKKGFKKSQNCLGKA